MGALVEAEGNGEKGAAKSYTEKICASNTVVYQLVEVDGRLVSATDDELMEVEHLLEDDSTKLQVAEIQRHTEKSPSREWILPKTSTFEGHSYSEGLEVDSQNLDADLEILENAYQEETLWLKCATVNRPLMGEIVGDDHLKHSQSCDDRCPPQKTSVGTLAKPTC